MEFEVYKETKKKDVAVVKLELSQKMDGIVYLNAVDSDGDWRKTILSLEDGRILLWRGCGGIGLQVDEENGYIRCDPEV